MNVGYMPEPIFRNVFDDNEVGIIKFYSYLTYYANFKSPNLVILFYIILI